MAAVIALPAAPAAPFAAVGGFARSQVTAGGWLGMMASSSSSPAVFLAADSRARGLALEKLAVALTAGNPQDPVAIRRVFLQAAEAWQESVAVDPTQTPIESLNWLRTAWFGGRIAGERCRAAADLACRCGAQIRRRFLLERKAGDALLTAESFLLAWLLGAKLPGAPDGDPATVLGLIFDEALAAADLLRLGQIAVASASIERLRITECALSALEPGCAAAVVRALRERVESRILAR